jgi:hypothetical protein
MTQISDDDSKYLNTAGEWIYYVNGSDNDCLYRICTDGTQRTKICDDACGSINVDDGWIYYSNASDGGKLYKIRTDGTQRERLGENKCGRICTAGDWVYYEDESDSGNLRRIHKDGTWDSKLAGEIYTVGTLDGTFEYTEKPDGTLFVTRYTGFASTVKIPSEFQGKSVTGIGNSASDGTGSIFFWCDSPGKIKEIIIPDSVTSISDFAFRGCGLESITIPESVTSIGYGAFFWCGSLNFFDVASSNPSYSSEDGILYDKDKTALICCPATKSGTLNIPDSVKSIGDLAFLHSKLTAVIMPDSVTSIGSQTFLECFQLTNIKLSRNLKTIGDGAFICCNKLKKITIPEDVESIGTDVFRACSSLTAINVAGSNTSYSSVDGVLYNKSRTVMICRPNGKSEADKKDDIAVWIIVGAAMVVLAGGGLLWNRYRKKKAK